MIRCCQRGGRISVQDIVAYSDDKINKFFEEFERSVDVSHHKTLSKKFIQNLFERRKIKIKKTFEIEIELNFQEYLGHSNQSEESKEKISNFIEKGLNDPEISKYFVINKEVLFFNRNVFLILGEK